MSVSEGIPYQDNQLVQVTGVDWLDHLCIEVTSVARKVQIRTDTKKPRTSVYLQNPTDAGAAVYWGASDVTATYGAATRGGEIDIGKDLSPDLTDTPELYVCAKQSDIQVVGSLDIDTITWQSGTTVRVAFNGSPDLSSVTTDHWLIVTGSTNSSNNGAFKISAVNDGSDYVDITNASRTDDTDDEATDATGTGVVEDPTWLFVAESR